MNKLGTKLSILALGGALLTGVAITSGAAQSGAAQSGAAVASGLAQPVLAGGDISDISSTSTSTSTPARSSAPLPESDAARATLLRTLPTIRVGSKGDAVLALQIGLRSKGARYLQGTGSFGALTAKAVKDFQRSHGLTADGVVGSRTWDALVERGTGEPFALSNPQLRPGQLWTQAAETGLNNRTHDYLRWGLTRLSEVTTWVPTPAFNAARYEGAEVAAVRELQRRAGLTPSGILGARTTRLIVLIGATMGGFNI